MDPTGDGGIVSRVPSPVARLLLTGDLMWIQSGWKDVLPASTLAFLRSFDGIVCNLETPVSSSHRVPEVWPDVFRYNAPPSLLQNFCRPDGTSLFAALSIANNHSLDLKDEGALETMRTLQELHIPHSGVRAKVDGPTIALFTVNGIKVGFYAATFGMNKKRDQERAKVVVQTITGMAPPIGVDNLVVELTEPQSALAEMSRAGAQLRIVSLHWGHEFEYRPSATQRGIARALSLAGADIVLGSHPHVPQPWEVFYVNQSPPKGEPDSCALTDHTGTRRKTLVIYSAGNFLTAMFGIHSRLASTFEIGLTVSSDGVEWHLQAIHHLLNVARDRRGKRALLTMAEATALLRGWNGRKLAREVDYRSRLLRTDTKEQASS